LLTARRFDEKAEGNFFSAVRFALQVQQTPFFITRSARYSPTPWRGVIAPSSQIPTVVTSSGFVDDSWRLAGEREAGPASIAATTVAVERVVLRHLEQQLKASQGVDAEGLSPLLCAPKRKATAKGFSAES
jgi:hypothetical protein